MAKLLKYSRYVKKEIKQIKNLRSGERTRLTVLSCFSELLDSYSFNEINTKLIITTAGISQGTFYIYFKDKDDLVCHLLASFLQFESTLTPIVDNNLIVDASTPGFVNWYAELFMQNRGILTTVIQLKNTSSDLTLLWQRRREMYDLLLLDSYSQLVELKENERQAMRVAISIASDSLDQLLSKTFGIVPNPNFSNQVDLQTKLELYELMFIRSILGVTPTVRRNSLAKALAEVNYIK
jgi:AcrR family transcriptional regulator